MSTPRPASGDTIYIIHAYGSVTRPKRPSDLDLLTLKVVPESRVTRATSVPILVFLGLSVLELDLMYTTDRRQTHRRQTSSSLNAPPGAEA